jgi:nucleoside phosphorylase/tetratricopeptide (TPR) repeat protein
MGTKHGVDVLYVLALDEDEQRAARAVAQGPFLGHPGVAEWTPLDVDDATPYDRGDFVLADGSRFSVAMTSQLRMAADSASRTLATLVERLHPRCLAMSGVCAGRPGVAALGDVIVAETSYFAADGKKTSKGFRPDIRTHSMPVRWLRTANALVPDDLPSYAAPTEGDIVDWFLVSLYEGRDPRDQPERAAYLGHRPWKETVNDLIDQGLIARGDDHRVILTPAGDARARAYEYDYPEAPPTLPFAVRVGPMTSKPYVDASDPWEVLTASGVRTVIGLEMESASVAASAHDLDVRHWIVAKGVMDDATSGKGDRHKSFAARASAEVVWKFLIDRRMREPSSVCHEPEGEPDAPSVYAESSPAGISKPTLPATNLRRHGDSFVDREVTRAECVASLRGETKVVTVFGWPGAGKSRLAFEVANDLRPDFDDHVYVVDLSLVADPDLVLTTITQVLQVEARDPLIDALREVFRGTPSLLVLENFERVAGAASRVEDLLEAAPDLQMLITSESPLGLRVEHLIEAEPLPPEYGRELFLARARRSDVSPDELAGINDLCAALNQLPLAIEVVAAQARTSTLGELHRVLRSPAFLDLENQMQGIPDRHRTVGLAIGWSFDLLDLLEQTIFVRLSVFDGSWTERAAEAVVGDLVEEQQAIRWMYPLLDRRFVLRDTTFNADVGTAESRFTMFFPMRQFGRQRLQANAELSVEVRTAHAAYYLELVERWAERIAGGAGLDTLHQVAHDHGNIHAALGFLVEVADTLSAVRMAVALDTYWWSRNYAEGYHHLKAVLDLKMPGDAGREDLLRRGRACHAAGKLAIRQFELDRAAALFTEAASIGHEMGSPALAASSLERGALVDIERGRYKQAGKTLTDAMDIFSSDDSRAGVEGRADCLDGLGIVACELGDPETGEKYFQAALALYADVSGPQLSAWVRNDQAQAAYLRGDLLMARLHAEYVQTVGRKYEDLGLLTWSGNTLGHVATAQRDLDTARSYFSESLTLSLLQGNPRPQLRALEGFVVVASRAGKHASAIVLLAAVDRLRGTAERRLPRANTELQLIEDAIGISRARLSEAETIRSLDAGSLMSLDLTAEFARSL